MSPPEQKFEPTELQPSSQPTKRGSQRIWLRFAADLAACGVVSTVGTFIGASVVEMISTGLPLERIPEFLNGPLPAFSEPVKILGISVPHGLMLEFGTLGGGIAGAIGYFVARSKLPKRG